jgi:hypothetical protein
MKGAEAPPQGPPPQRLKTSEYPGILE